MRKSIGTTPVVMTAVGALLDEAVIAALANDLSEDLMPTLVATFIEEAEQRIGAIEQAVVAGDVRLAGEEAHALKGGAATFGAHALRETAFAIEEAGRACAVDAVRDQLEALRSHGSLTIAALRERYLDTTNRG